MFLQKKAVADGQARASDGGTGMEPPPLKVAMPCPKQWGELRGDAKRRFCAECGLHVHNLSAMKADERERFVAEAGRVLRAQAGRRYGAEAGRAQEDERDRVAAAGASADAQAGGRVLAEADGRICIAYELRADGTMVTPPGRWARLAQPLRRLQVAAIAFLATVAPVLFSSCASRRTVMLGEVAPAASHKESVETQIVLGGIPASGCEVRPGPPRAR